MRLPRKFYTQPTLTVAKQVLGKYIVRVYRGRKIAGKIVETEAYIGPEDKASHAYQGKLTPRNQAEYFIGGHIYIYLIYGMYWQLNISTSLKGKPECVLIRALEPVIVKNHQFITPDLNKLIKINNRLVKISELAKGPGKVCQYLKLNKSFYGEDLCTSQRIWLEDRGVKVSQGEIVSTRRIGIDYAGPYWSKRKWRFYLKNSPCVSKR